MANKVTEKGFDQSNINWFPGHMAKTRRLISESLKLVDAVIEVLDARVPISSRNPEIIKLLEGKPTLTILNKASLADPEASRRWLQYFREKGQTVPLLVDCSTGEGLSSIAPALNELLAEKIAHWHERGMVGRHVKAMIVGVPNVGKSTLINRLSAEKKAKAENRPGVTRRGQWVVTKSGFNLYDTPGVLWPKFDDKIIGQNLAFTGAIKEEILDIEELASQLTGRLRHAYPALLSERYKLGDMYQYDELTDYELLLEIGRRRGFLISGGEVNSERASSTLLDEFRAAKIGRMTLELPDNQNYD